MKEYVIWKSTTAAQPLERVVKTEQELTKQDEDLFLGQLINDYESSPPIVQLRFFQYLGKQVELI